jgi:hypothetical protein
MWLYFGYSAQAKKLQNEDYTLRITEFRFKVEITPWSVEENVWTTSNG